MKSGFNGTIALFSKEKGAHSFRSCALALIVALACGVSAPPGRAQAPPGKPAKDAKPAAQTADKTKASPPGVKAAVTPGAKGAPSAGTKPVPPAVGTKPAVAAAGTKPAPLAPGVKAPQATPQEISLATFVKPKRPLAAISALAFSPDGAHVAVGTYGEVVLLDAKTWAQTGIFRQIEDSARTLVFHPDSKTLAIGSGLPGRTGQTSLWDISGTQKPRVYPPQQDTVEAIAFDRGGASLLIGANDNKGRYFPAYAVMTNKVLDSHNGRVDAVALSPKPNSIFVTGAMDKIVKVWDTKTVENVINFDQSEAGITGLAFLGNGDQFVGGSLDGRLYWWGVSHNEKKNEYNGYHFRTVDAHPGGVYTLSPSWDSRFLITGGADNTVAVWDLNSGGEIKRFKDSTLPIYAVALSPDGKTAVAGGREGLVCVWDVASGKITNIFVPPALPTAPTSGLTPAVHAFRRARHGG